MTLRRTAAVRLSISAPELAAALDAIRFAASSDPELPMLGGVLFDIEGDLLYAVTTDRYRMAVARAGTAGHGGPRRQVFVPLPLADAMRALLTDDASVQLTVDGDRVALQAGDRQAAGQCLTRGFPDYRRLVRPPSGHGILVDVRAFRQAVETGPVRAGAVREQDSVSGDLSVLKVTADGMVTVCDEHYGDHGQIAVNRAFLLDALTAGAQDQLILEFSGPTAPLAIRRTDAEETCSMLMPVRLES
jgi:DNA polymerase III sliding clamp (beta) subunit (PCNA family)